MLHPFNIDNWRFFYENVSLNPRDVAKMDGRVFQCSA